MAFFCVLVILLLELVRNSSKSYLGHNAMIVPETYFNCFDIKLPSNHSHHINYSGSPKWSKLQVLRVQQLSSLVQLRLTKLSPNSTQIQVTLDHLGEVWKTLLLLNFRFQLSERLYEISYKGNKIYRIDLLYKISYKAY